MSIKHENFGQRGNFGRRIMASGAVVVCAAAMAGLRPASISGETLSPAVSAVDCNDYPPPSSTNNHEREVCNAYKHNVFGIALRDFYILGNNRFSFSAKKSLEHLETRYSEVLSKLIKHRVDNWGVTNNPLGNEVDMHVNLYGRSPISSNLKADRAVVRVQQNVDVYSGDDDSRLYHEPLHTQYVTMCRGKLPQGKGALGVHFLHSWFVVKNTADPGFPCIDYDKAHNIQP